MEGFSLESTIAAAFGTVLRRLRMAAGLTQEQLGLKAGLQRKYISLLELGTKAPSLATVLRIATALDLEPGELVSQVSTKLREA